MGNNLLRSLKISTILLCATVIFLPACDDNDEVEAEVGLTVAPSYPELNNASFASDAKVRQASIPTEGAFPVNTANEVTASRPSKKNNKKKKEDHRNRQNLNNRDVFGISPINIRNTTIHKN